MALTLKMVAGLSITVAPPSASNPTRLPLDTDWARIAALYGDLVALTRSPIVELNRAVAVSRAEDRPPGSP